MKRLFFFLFLIEVYSCHDPAHVNDTSRNDTIAHPFISETTLSYTEHTHIYDNFKRTAEGNYVFLLRTTPAKNKRDPYGDYFLLTLSPDGDTLQKNQVANDFVSPAYIELEGYYYIVAKEFDTMKPEGWFYLSKYDKDWKLLWRKTIGKPVSPDSNAELVLTAKKELLVVADEEQVPGNHKTSNGMSVSKYSGDGNLLFRKFYPRKDLLTSGPIIPSLDNHYFISALLYKRDSSTLRIVKINEAGDTLWTRDHRDFEPRYSLQLKDSSLLFFGNDYSRGTNEYNSFLVVLKTDKNGNLLWRKELKENYSEAIGNMIALQNGHYLFSATIKPTRDGEYFAYIYELDKDGNRVFHKKFDFSADIYNRPVLLQGNKQIVMVSQKWIDHSGKPFKDVILITRLAEN